MAYFYNYPANPILWDLGFIKIHWYGLLVVMALLVCLRIAWRFKSWAYLTDNHFYNLSFYLIVFGIVGARLWHVVFYNLNYFLADPLAILKIWQGGLAIHGALLAGILTVYFYGRKHQLVFFRLTDLFSLVLPLGQAIGRWGNYFNQELFGHPCEQSWCLAIEPANRPEASVEFSHFQPLFLYESILDIILFFGLLLFFKSKFKPGIITGLYLAGYSVIRFFMEFLRLDANTAVLGLKGVQWLSLAIIILAVGWLTRVLSNKKI